MTFSQEKFYLLMDKRKAKLSELADLIGCHYIGDDIIINGLNLCNRPTDYDSILGYTTSELFFDAIYANSHINALVLTKELYEKLRQKDEMGERKMSYIISDEPEVLFYQLQNKLCKETDYYQIESKRIIGRNCKIHPSAIIEEGTVLGDDVTVGANSVVCAGARIGDNTYIGCCSVIGEDGFQAIHGMEEHIYHSGGVEIGKGVTIGNNTSICRSLFEGATHVGDFSKIDNQVQVSHNCIVGKQCTICVGSLLLGSSTLEDEAYIAPGSVIMNQKTVGEGAFVGTMSYVNKTIKPRQEVFGIPARKLPTL